MNDNDVKKWITAKYNKLVRKKKNSIRLYAFIHIVYFLLTALVVVLNIWAIRKNEFPETKIYFVLLSVLGTVTGLMISLSSFFKFKYRIETTNEKIKLIVKELKLYNKKIEQYDGKKANSLLIKNVLLILDDYNKYFH